MEQEQRDILKDELDGVEMNISNDENGDEVNEMIFGKDQTLTSTPIIRSNNVANSRSS